MTLWTDFNLLNDSSLDLTAINAKMESFLSLPINELMGCFPTEGGHCIYADPFTNQSAVDIFLLGLNNSVLDSTVRSTLGGRGSRTVKYFGINTPLIIVVLGLA